MSKVRLTPSLFFVTGTDTEVGKTIITGAVGVALAQQNLAYTFKKPAASGCGIEQTPASCADCRWLQAINPRQSYQQITHWAFADAVAPCVAAHQHNQHLRLTDMVAFCLDTQDTNVVIEGAGGLYSPLATDGLNIDLVQALQQQCGLQVILVVGNRLGCMNHALMSLTLCQQQQIGVHSIIVNDVWQQPEMLAQHQQWLAKLTKKTIYSCSYQAHMSQSTPTAIADQVCSELSIQGWQIN